MQRLLLVVLVVPFAACSLLNELERLKQELTQYEYDLRDVDDTEVDDENGEGSLKVKDADGKVVSNVTILEEEKLQVEQPTDRNACLIRDVETNATCFNEKPFPEPVPAKIKALCSGRDLLRLEPGDCEENSDEPDDVDERGQRKQTSCVRFTYSISCQCNCCQRLWILCTKRCCSRKVIWTRHEIKGYRKQFHVKL